MYIYNVLLIVINMEPNSYFLAKLNDNCKYRGSTAMDQWEEDDIVNGRNHCYWWPKDYGLCSACQNTLAEFRCQQEKIAMCQNIFDTQADILNRLDEMMKEISNIKEHLNML